MKNSNRRDFCKLAALGALATTLTSRRAAAEAAATPPVRLRLACQEGVAPGKDLNEKLDFLEGLGFEGLEVGGGGLSRRVEEFQKALQGRKLKLAAVCAGYGGCLTSDQETERQKAITSMKEVITAAGALGSTGMILVPAFNGQTKLGHWEIRELLLQLLPELGDFAQKAGTRVILEPLNRKEAHFLRQVADAAQIAKDCKHDGVCVMGDFWHMTWEEPSDFAAFVAAGSRLHQVHIASRKTRRVPGEDEGDNYVDGFKGLKHIGYQDFVSFECGAKADKKQSIPAAVKLLRAQWQEA
jgi:sugar phosphate isomerase/epimerase